MCRWWPRTQWIGAGLLVGLAGGPIRAQEQRPNVVLIIADDQAWTDFGFMGHEVVRTPRLDRLAAEGARFLHGYVPTALCRASLATIATGLYGHQHRICCNDPPDGTPRQQMLPLIREVETLPRLLAAAGYLSLQTGKWWEGHFSAGGFTHGMTTEGRHGGPGLAIGRETMQPILDFLDECAGRPFLLWYAPMMPHLPHDSPSQYLERYAQGRPPRLAAYYAMCEWFDATCGQLLDELDARGLTRDTLVVFLADNGWIQETGPQRTTRGWFAPRSKLSPNEGGVRTPVLLRWPGRIEPGRHEGLVSAIDVVPTVLAACGVAAPASLPGRDLLEVLQGRADLEGRALFGETYLHTARDLADPARNLTHRWVRQDRWKLIVFEEPGRNAELYDLIVDPFERADVSAANAPVVARLHGRLDAWWGGRPAGGRPVR